MTADRYTFETYDRFTLRGRKWFFRYRAPNGEIMFPSQPYSSAQARDESLRTIKRTALSARTVKVTA